ncbi:S-adenosyl-l-methionine hydroxide adenosyltransferase family protein [Candidatus Bathyarchaeota archaeon]|nr:S-adenosyl-l-methionine hydroxide adenosyltransferase family protein [Candidatus Bathyarchaeota archaeon]
MNSHPIVTLLTDFGTRDPYVAQMKAVILSICPRTVIVDISHNVEKFNVRMGAFILASATPYFPPGSIHMAVVDPAVGTKRAPLLIETKNFFFVGPDNGLLILAAQADGIEQVYQIENQRYLRPAISYTFHGRDVFAPVAGYLAKGVSPQKIGSKLLSYVVPSFSKPSIKNGKISGEINYIDSFGNVVTNIPASLLEQLRVLPGQLLQLRIKRKSFAIRFCRAYGEVQVGELLGIIGSHNFLELSINQGNAAGLFNVVVGDTVELHLA